MITTSCHGSKFVHIFVLPKFMTCMFISERKTFYKPVHGIKVFRLRNNAKFSYRISALWVDRQCIVQLTEITIIDTVKGL